MEQEFIDVPERIDSQGFQTSADGLDALKEKFRLIFERSIDPSFLLEGDTFVDCNEAALELLRCPAREKLIGLCPLDISPERQPDGRPSKDGMREMIGAALCGGGLRFEWKNLTFDGREIFVDISLTSIPLKGRQILYAVSRSIPEAKSRDKTKEDKHFFPVIVEKAPFAMAAIDRNGNYIYANPRFKQLFGSDVSIIPRNDACLVETSKGEENCGQYRDWAFTIPGKESSKRVFKVTSVELPSGYLEVYQDNTANAELEEILRKKEEELMFQSTKFQEMMNGALEMLLNEKHADRNEIEAKMVSNVNKLVLPYIDELRQCRLDAPQTAYVDIIENNLKRILSPFLEKLGLRSVSLTLREIRVADLVKSGRTTKEISELLQMSGAAVNFHRNNIRKKLGITNRKVNLAAYLSSL